MEQVIKPIWETIPPTAKRVREHSEGILDWATAKGYRIGDNPASLKGPLGVRLKPFDSVHTTKHRPSLPYQEIGAEMARLRAYRIKGTNIRTVVSYALEFTILTAARSEQVILLPWAEIDFDEQLWICFRHKAFRMKTTKQPLQIPLSKQAMAILDTMRARQAADGTAGNLVFVHPPSSDPGLYTKPRAGRPLSDSTMIRFLQVIFGRRDLTVHGFRNTFGSWADDQGFPEKDIERALGHVVGDGETDVARRYRRGANRLDPRRQQMQAWADYCDQIAPLPAEVVPFRQAK